MHIKFNDSDNSIEVLGIYWVNGKKYYWIIPHEGYQGFLAVSEDNCVVTDSFLSSDMIICKGDDGTDEIIHWAAHDLLEDLVEHDARAMMEFIRRRK
ncbi:MULTISPECIES: hypothetical protein [Xanthomonas]|uniref:hypothetical protein n=1 Tax=Xanthomonas TaxID=338 RepID=UPI000CEE394D|nr:hypothetical protein [Xanthomonas arboricola]PPT40873.1 hypothetical protein XarbCFBP8132_12655 [Xanthomonas arboricola]PPT70406.1 hypothetical protein XarbCFBP8142_02025 [Xanthomonas arboricola]CAG2089597.1 hypothetical protein XCY_001965 [Xanthomonas arboricola pv. juglandis]